MDVGNVFTDSLKYPLSGWNRFFLLGIIFVVSGILSSLPAYLGIYNWSNAIIFSLIGWLVGLFAYGYQLRILEASIAGIDELPNFDKWKVLFINGLKYFFVELIYFLPAIIIVIISALALFSTFVPYLTDPNLASSFDPSIMLSNLTVGAIIGILIALLYMLIVFPLVAMAIAHMALNGEFSAAFRVREITAKMSSIGWGNIIVWYILIIVLSIIIALVGGFIFSFLGFLLGFGNVIAVTLIQSILSSLILSPYLVCFLQRSIADVYVSDEE